MISGGNATVYVSNMDAAVRFYTESLGLKLTNRFGNHWATIEAGPSYWTTDEVGAGLVIGLHPAIAEAPGAGHDGRGGVRPRDLRADRGRRSHVSSQRGVRMTSDIIRFEAGNSVSFEDPDGTPTYLHEFPPEMVPQTRPRRGRAIRPRKPAPACCQAGTQSSTSPRWMPPSASIPTSSGST